MITSDIVGHSPFCHVVPRPISGAGRAKVNHVYVRKGARRPAKHVRFYFIQRVPTRRVNQATYIRPASASIDFRRAPHMKFRIDPGFNLNTILNGAADGAPGYSQTRILIKMPETPLEVVAFK